MDDFQLQVQIGKGFHQLLTVLTQAEYNLILQGVQADLQASCFLICQLILANTVLHHKI
jgi:hypothetical protein